MKKLAVLMLMACFPLAANIITFTLDPVGGEISGAPGTPVGWGFTLDNESGNFLLIDNAVFNSATAVGASVDYSGYAPELGPSPYNTSYTAPFILNTAGALGFNGSGLMEFEIVPSAVPLSSWSGQVVLTYDLYSTDPATDPNAVDISAGNAISADATIDVVPAQTVSTPEPGSFGLLLSGLVLISYFALVTYCPGKSFVPTDDPPEQTCHPSR